ncbi:UNVERIFIED_CONTAM: hypothetical protein FKN15_054727 [Acipenser sinensis]
MGKKSVLDSPVLDSPDQQSVNSLREALDRDINVQEIWELITQEVLKIALKAQQQDTRGKLDVNDQIYCLTSPDVSSTWNNNRACEKQYTQQILDALVMRFEAPDSRNRWDSPLFTIQKEDTLPFEAISDAIFHRKAPPPNQSTQSQPLSSSNFLYELDKVTQDVVTAVLNAQKTSVPGDLIAVPEASEKISLLRHVVDCSYLRVIKSLKQREAAMHSFC